MRKLIFLAPLAFVAACETYDLGNLSELRPTDDPNRFVWVTNADAVYPVDDLEAEAARLRQLDRVMSLNCPGGYTVENRRATQVANPGLFGTVFDVFYSVRC